MARRGRAGQGQSMTATHCPDASNQEEQVALNIVEAIQGPDSDCAFDQPCQFGHRVEGHAVYCHNDNWRDGPRKCRRTWYTGGKTGDEDCPGFEPNRDFRGEIHETIVSDNLCSKCNGKKVRPTDRGHCETCQHCAGEGVEPHSMPLSGFEQDTLEMGVGHSECRSAQYERQVRIAETRAESDKLSNLEEAGLIRIHQVSSGSASGVLVFLFSLTGKGDAVMRANWEQNKKNGH